MTNHTHDRDHPHHRSHGKDAPDSRSSKPRTIVVVGIVLMLVAMLVYVLTVDESLAPGNEGERIEAAE
ncbi:MAG: DUF350 domain-containing protein [Phycisphaerales bacterium]|jgi:hypothetical protein